MTARRAGTGGLARHAAAILRRTVPLPYYQRLSKRDKAIYRRSDAIAEVPLEDVAAMRPRAEAVRRALATDDRVAVEAAARRLVGAILFQLGTAPVDVRVMATRPSDDWGELHGLYTAEEGKRPLIQVWMRTAAHRRVVAFRTFVRTLMHEVCHHLDYVFFHLADSFHTEGFFRRESSLVRKLVPGGDRASGLPRPPAKGRARVAKGKAKPAKGKAAAEAKPAKGKGGAKPRPRAAATGTKAAGTGAEASKKAVPTDSPRRRRPEGQGEQLELPGISQG